MKKSLLYEIITAMLILLFIDSGFSKVFDHSGFRRAMHNQPFPFWFAELLAWTIPPVEILVMVALIYAKTRLYGLYASLILLVLFTGYIVAILFGVFSKVPCNCGEFIQSLSWGQHLVFNLVFVFLACYDIKLIKELN